MEEMELLNNPLIKTLRDAGWTIRPKANKNRTTKEYIYAIRGVEGTSGKKTEEVYIGPWHTIKAGKLSPEQFQKIRQKTGIQGTLPGETAQLAG